MFLFQVVFTPTLLVMLQTAVRNVQMVLTWHMTKNLENLYWTARHVLTVITEHVLFDAKGFKLSVCTHLIKCCLEAWKEWGKWLKLEQPYLSLETNPARRQESNVAKPFPAFASLCMVGLKIFFFHLRVLFDAPRFIGEPISWSSPQSIFARTSGLKVQERILSTLRW